MNERIQELADKIWAEEYWDNPATDKLLPAQLNKFAELIVQECIDIIAPYSVRMSRPGEEYLHPIQEIKQHFGVEDRAIPILSADEQALFAGITSSKLFTIEAAKKAFGVKE